MLFIIFGPCANGSKLSKLSSVNHQISGFDFVEEHSACFETVRQLNQPRQTSLPHSLAGPARCSRIRNCITDMKGNHSRSLKEQFHPKSEAWQEEHSAVIVRFWCSDGACWGIPFSQVLGTHYDPEQQRLLIECSIGSVVVIGPKAWDFYDAFCSQRATMLKADGKDILNVTMVLRGEAAPG
jgi:hypothetical protein